MSHRRRGDFLIIANGRYENNQSLPGTEKDAAELSETFEQYGFKITIVQNETKEQMKEEIRHRKSTGHVL